MNLYPYQKEVVDKALSMTSAGLFLDMGLGKTAIALSIIENLMKTDKDIRVLIIAPKAVVLSTWVSEITKFMPSLVNYNVVCKQTNADKVFTSELLNNLANPDYKVTLLSHSLLLPFARRGYLKLFNTLIIDESSKFKSYDSKSFKALKSNLKYYKRRFIMTGTPISNGYMDLWSQIYILDNGIRLGRNITAYRSMFFYNPNPHLRYIYELQPDAENVIKSLVSSLIISKTTLTTPIELPPLLEYSRHAPLPPLLKNEYNKFHDDFVFKVTHEDITASNKAVLTNKLLQFLSGFVYDNHNEPVTIHELKLDILESILTEYPHKILLAYNYKHEATMLQNSSFSDQLIFYRSDMSTITAWQKGEAPRVLCAHPASIGYGLNLQHDANMIVWYGHTWNLELYQQFNKRLHRQGQQQTVYCIHITCGDLEHELLNRLTKKGMTQLELQLFLENYLTTPGNPE